MTYTSFAYCIPESTITVTDLFLLVLYIHYGCVVVVLLYEKGDGESVYARRCGSLTAA